jgi:hypothetical protein
MRFQIAVVALGCAIALLSFCRAQALSESALRKKEKRFSTKAARAFFTLARISGGLFGFQCLITPMRVR